MGTPPCQSYIFYFTESVWESGDSTRTLDVYLSVIFDFIFESPKRKSFSEGMHDIEKSHIFQMKSEKKKTWTIFKKRHGQLFSHFF